MLTIGETREAACVLHEVNDQECAAKPTAMVSPANSKLDDSPCSFIKVRALESKTPLVATYIKQPDGSMWMANPEGFEEANTKQPPSPKLKQQSSEGSHNPSQAIGIFWKALGRRELIRNLLNIELLIDFLLGAVGFIELLGNPDLPSSVSSRLFWIPLFWLLYAGVQFLLGFVVISNARHELYGWLVITSVTAILMHLAVALLLSMSHLPTDVPSESLAAALIPITVFTDLPMRLAIGVHAFLLHCELRYLYRVPLSSLRDLS